MSMSEAISPSEAISLYPTTEDIARDVAVGRPSDVGVVKVGGSTYGDPLNMSNRFSRSLVYPDPSIYHRARESIIWNQNFRQTFPTITLPLQPASLTILNNLGVMSYLCIDISLPANASPNVTLPRGWGIYLIDHIDFLAAGTTISVYGQQLAQWYFHVMKSQEQLDRVFDLAGSTRTGTWAANEPRAQIIVPVPWSIPNGWCLDTSLLQANNIQVNAYFNSITTVAGGSGASALTNSLASGSYYAETGQYTNVARDSILGELAAFANVNGDSLVQSNVFMQMVYSPSIAISCGGPTVDTSVNLTGFDLSRRLKGIAVSFIQQANVTPGGGLPINPSAYETVSDLILTFVGKQVIASFNTEVDLIQALRTVDKPQVLSSVLITGGPAAPYTLTNIASRMYRLMFTLEDNDDVIEHGLPGVQSLQMSFKTSTVALYNIYVSFLYDRSLTFSGTGLEIS